MYCLTLFSPGVPPSKQYGTEDALYAEAQLLQAQGLVTAWRIVNVHSGTCTLHWKKGEDTNAPVYRH